MRIKVISLEDKILNNKAYLLAHYSNTEMVIEQISMILHFGLSNEEIKNWFRLNKIAIGIIENLLKEEDTE